MTMSGRGAKLVALATGTGKAQQEVSVPIGTLYADELVPNVEYAVEIPNNPSPYGLYDNANMFSVEANDPKYVVNGEGSMQYSIPIIQFPGHEGTLSERSPTIVPMYENDSNNLEDGYSRIISEDVDDPDFIPNYESNEQEHLTGNESSTGNENQENTLHSTREVRLSEEQIAEGDSKENHTSKKKKKRNKCSNPKMWDKNQNKMKRMIGKEYVGYSRSKDGIVKHDVNRAGRSMGVKCDSKFCKKAQNRFCDLFTNENRTTIFNKFWNMNWEQKRLFLVHTVCYLEKSRSYVKNPSRRSGTFQYYLHLDTVKYQVCKQTFLGTLGIGEKMVHHWVNEGNKYGLLEKQEDRNKVQMEKRKVLKSHADMVNRKKHLRDFFMLLPKLESHYCRKRTSKLYFEYDFKCKAEVYQVYKTKCSEDNKCPLSIYTFTNEMDNANIAIFKPRKDQCDMCRAYKVKQLEQNIYDNHIRAKDAIRKEKDLDKSKAEEGLIYCFTMDVEAVKLCPKTEVSAAYYKTKLQVHNFTIYDLATKDSKNFLWNESEGELCAAVFTSCIVAHLKLVLSNEIKPVVLYSDSCGYQNKNAILSNALSLLASKYNVHIEQKYLEKGHTQMECDSTHSLIERRLKGRDILLPTDYLAIVKDARKNPKPLDVEYLTHTFFLNYDDPNSQRYSSIRPGHKKHDLKVSDLRLLKYLPDGDIMYKTKLTDSYAVLPQIKIEIDLNYTYKPLYSQRLKIKKQKWTHLQEYKSVLPVDTHYFYDLLPYDEPASASNSKQCKLDTDTKKTTTTKRKMKTKNIKKTRTSQRKAESKKFKKNTIIPSKAKTNTKKTTMAKKKK